MTVSIIEARNEDDITAAKALFQAYAESLDFSLCFQDFDSEMTAFPGKYAPPQGCLLLARVDGKPAGAVGLWALEDGVCEMKRLYVDPVFRGLNLGRRLCDALIAAAGERGYTAMRLDTIPGRMDDAIALYRDLGFAEIPPYTYNPIEGAIYLERPL
jgi:ribosomal protein S18 acetylase RimI-like enzyme